MNQPQLYPNYGFKRNFTYLIIGPLDLWYSYKTVIAFRTPATGLVVSENLWGPTTGKHINAISRDQRTPRTEFQARLDEVMARLMALICLTVVGPHRFSLTTRPVAGVRKAITVL